MNSKNDQKLIIINGLLNSGKTILFNLLRKEKNFICLDISPHHYKIYEQETIDQIGKENLIGLKPYVETTDIFITENFLREFGLLMQKFPEYSFAIKPGNYNWVAKEYNDKWLKLKEQYMPGVKLSNIHHVFAIRNPMISWTTTYMKNMTKFLELWGGQNLEDLNLYEIIKIEEIKDNKLFNQIIKNNDLKQVVPYTIFDLKQKPFNNYDNLMQQLKIVEKELRGLMEFLSYKKEDSAIQMFLDDDLDKYTGGI